MYRPTYRSVGLVVPSTCPPCSRLLDGSCEVCDDEDEDDKKHPSCQNCKAGVYKPPPTPWYESTFLWTVAGMVTAAVATSLVLHRIGHKK